MRPYSLLALASLASVFSSASTLAAPSIVTDDLAQLTGAHNPQVAGDYGWNGNRETYYKKRSAGHHHPAAAVKSKSASKPGAKKMHKVHKIKTTQVKNAPGSDVNGKQPPVQKSSSGKGDGAAAPAGDYGFAGGYGTYY